MIRMETKTTKKPTPMKLQEISQKIDAHLKRLEADPVSNVRANGKSGPRFYHAGACVAGRFVGVVYVSFQSMTKLSKAEAEAYLVALDGGSNGRHFDVFRETAAAAAASNAPSPE